MMDGWHEYCTFWSRKTSNLGKQKKKKSRMWWLKAGLKAEAKIRAVAQGICELLWIKLFLNELKIVFNHPMKLYSGDKVATSISHNPLQHDSTKHIEIDQHFIKEKLDAKVLYILFICTKQLVARYLHQRSLKSTIWLPNWETRNVQQL